jgi:hypothetical protein
MHRPKSVCIHIIYYKNTALIELLKIQGIVLSSADYPQRQR